MGINFDTLPKKKPGQSSIESGRYLAVVEKTSIGNGPAGDYIKVIFKTKSDGNFSEIFSGGDAAFSRYKIGRLLDACKVELEGEGTLNDVAKLIIAKKVTVDVTVNDKGYAGLDFTGTQEGVYARDEVVTEEIEDTPEAPALDSDVSKAITEDDDF